MNIIGIIPARFASTRFPGKPLVKIGGKTMIERVYFQSLKSIDNVIVATDDERIYNTVIDFGGEAVMTSSLHQSGTDRCCETLDITEKNKNKKYDIVINIQGDEPFIDPEQINQLKKLFNDELTQIATLITPIKSSTELFDFNKVKCVIDKNKFALYFSRQAIPYIRNYSQGEWMLRHNFYKHLGIYGFKSSVLREITKLPQSSLEVAESLEQNRWLENGYKIKTDITLHESIAIDTPEDLDRVAKMFENK
jgi:3-deoxy-manno-octulosonate cytidylyltransferase (CMP-KDO synthetase)